MTSSLSLLIDHIRAHPEFLRGRANFYTLRTWCEQVRAEHGLGAAMGASLELYMALGNPGKFAPSLSNWIEQILIDGINDERIKQLNIIGPYGHPSWHWSNPWFRIWHAASCDTSRVGSQWADGAASAKPRDKAFVDGLYKTFCETPNPGRDELAGWIKGFTEANGRCPRVLDYGCGYGNWLRWLYDNWIADGAALWGFDPLPERIKAARLITAPDIPSGNLWCADPMIDCKPDIIILAAVTGTMQDAELDRCLAQLAQTGARYIFETHAIDSVPAWIGRPNSDAFFARAGYKPLRSKFTGDVLTRENLPSLVLVQKYWLAGRCAIYERIT